MVKKLNQAQLPALEAAQDYSLSLIDISMRGVPRKDRERIRRRQMRKEAHVIRREKIHKKIVKGSAITVLGLSISLAGLFPTSSDLLRQQSIRQLSDVNPVEMMLEEEPGIEEDRKKVLTGSAGKSLWTRIKESLQNLVLQIPVWIRAGVFLPLWALGYLAVHLLSGVYQVVLAPVLSHIVSYILCAAVMLGVFVLTMKSIFPNMPLKKILRWKNIRRILIGAAILKVLDLFLPLIWGSYTQYKYLIMLIAGFLILGVILFARRRNTHSRRAAYSAGTGAGVSMRGERL